MTFHSLCASHCVPASGHHASLWSWHARSDQHGWRRTVLFEDKGTHLQGFAANHCLFAWTKSRGAQATVASDSVMASFQGRQGHGKSDGMLPSQHYTHICKQKPPYGDRKISDAFSVFGGGIPSRERPESQMAPCQTLTGRHLLAPSEAVQNRSKCGNKIVAEDWNQSHKCNSGGIMGRKPFPRCQLCTVPTAALEGNVCPLQRTKTEGLYHSSMQKKSMWKKRNNEQNE